MREQPTLMAVLPPEHFDQLIRNLQALGARLEPAARQTIDDTSNVLAFLYGTVRALEHSRGEP